MQKEKMLGYLGMATRAGKLVTGYNTCLDMIPRGKLKLVILAEDVGENTRKKLQDKCDSYEVPLHIGAGAEEMSRATGKIDKGVFGIMDKGFAESIIKAIESDDIRENKSEREVF